MTKVRLTFATEVPAPAEEVWTWSTSIRGIKAEMWPILKITFPKGMTHIGKDTALGKPLCRCQFLLLGLFPIDMSKLTFSELEPGRRFVEQSPLLSMRSWRHERVITPTRDGARVTDNLEFSPRLPRLSSDGSSRSSSSTGMRSWRAPLPARFAAQVRLRPKRHAD